MKIAIVLNTAWNIANFRAGLIRSLISNGHEVLAVAPADEFVKDIEQLGARFCSIKIDSQGQNPILDAILLWKYSKIFKLEKVDCILTYTIKPNIYASLAAQSQKMKVINNVSGLGTTFIRNSWIMMLVKPAYRQAFKKSEHVFFQNKEDRNLFLKDGLVRKEISSTIPGSGIDLAKFSPASESSISGTSTIKFLLIARLLLDKGICEYVEAAQKINSRFANVSFQLLGGLDQNNPRSIKKTLLDSWIRSNDLEYLGEERDVRPFIEEADCIVLPSYREGLPRVLLEAGAMARPSITTDVEGCRDVVVDNSTGLICKARDADMLAETMEKFINMPVEQKIKMGLKARERIQKEFDERIVIKAYMNIIDKFEE